MSVVDADEEVAIEDIEVEDDEDEDDNDLLGEVEDEEDDVSAASSIRALPRTNRKVLI